MVAPLPNKKKIVKRTKGGFLRFHSDRFLRVKPAWRRPRGIDNRVRRQFRGTRPLVKIGYGGDKRTKFLLPNGFKNFNISNLAELEMMLMVNRRYAATISAGVGAKLRKQIIARAHQLDIRITNERAKLKREENE